MIIIIIVLSIFIDLAFAEQNVVDVVIEKPKWCNSASLSHHYTFMELQKEYKYPCATYILEHVTFVLVNNSHLSSRAQEAIIKEHFFQ